MTQYNKLITAFEKHAFWKHNFSFICVYMIWKKIWTKINKIFVVNWFKFSRF